MLPILRQCRFIGNILNKIHCNYQLYRRRSSYFSSFLTVILEWSIFNQFDLCNFHDSRKIVLISVSSPMSSCNRWIVVYTVTALIRPKSNRLHIWSTKLRYKFFFRSSWPRVSKNRVQANGIWQSPTNLKIETVIDTHEGTISKSLKWYHQFVPFQIHFEISDESNERFFDFRYFKIVSTSQNTKHNIPNAHAVFGSETWPSTIDEDEVL